MSAEIETTKRTPEAPAAPALGPLAPLPASGGEKMAVVVLEDIEELARYSGQWEALAERAIEPNPFYEPWMLMPALRSLGAGRNFKFVLIFDRSHPNCSGRPLLCGFFPLEIKPSYEGFGTRLPMRTASLWQHDHCFLCTPLVSRERVRECVKAFFQWIDRENFGCPLIDFGKAAGEGAFHRSLVEHLSESARLSYVPECFPRALFRPRENAEDYLAASLAGSRRKELRRLEKRLAETGPLHYDSLEPGGDIEGWISEFLELEATSWKGQEGTALLSKPGDRDFFVESARSAFRRGRLMMLALRVAGRPIAQKCNFIAGPGSFAFKIAYDESYAHFSPGVLLELENVRRLHARPEIEWMDSCASPNNFMINRLWTERLTIQSTLISTGKARGDFVVSSVPMMKWIKRKFFRRRSKTI